MPADNIRRLRPSVFRQYVHVPDELTAMYDDALANLGPEGAKVYLREAVSKCLDEAHSEYAKAQEKEPIAVFGNALRGFWGWFSDFATGPLLVILFWTALIGGVGWGVSALYHYIQNRDAARLQKAQQLGLIRIDCTATWIPTDGTPQGITFKDVRTETPGEHPYPDITASIQLPPTKQPGQLAHIVFSFYDADCEFLATQSADITSYGGPSILHFETQDGAAAVAHAEYVIAAITPNDQSVTTSKIH